MYIAFQTINIYIYKYTHTLKQFNVHKDRRRLSLVLKMFRFSDSAISCGKLSHASIMRIKKYLIFLLIYNWYIIYFFTDLPNSKCQIQISDPATKGHFHVGVILIQLQELVTQFFFFVLIL